MVPPEDNHPIDLFREWMRDAEASEPWDATAMSLATADAQGRPSVRMVLLKGVDERGFVFYTNLDSRKGRELRDNPVASLCFFWSTRNRQVRVEGPVEPVDEAEADLYFASRPRLSRIGAWASKQSQPMESRFEFEKRVAEYTARFNVGEIPRPPFWSGFRIVPERIEFWEERQFRLHDRLVYTRQGEGWTVERLFP